MQAKAASSTLYFTQLNSELAIRGWEVLRGRSCCFEHFLFRRQSEHLTWAQPACKSHPTWERNVFRWSSIPYPAHVNRPPDPWQQGKSDVGTVEGELTRLFYVEFQPHPQELLFHFTAALFFHLTLPLHSPTHQLLSPVQRAEPASSSSAPKEDFS